MLSRARIAAACVVALFIVSLMFGLPLLNSASSQLSSISSISPPPLAPRIRAGSSSSLNWAGYAVTGPTGSVTDAKGSWIVPAIVGACPSNNQYSSFWVGIDGYSSSTVEQTGTDSDCQNGSPTYYAWYEFYPKPAFLVTSLTVNPGDKISAEVSYGGGQFTVSITDTTTGQSFSTSAKVSSAQRSSAEWITEAPSSSGTILPLADFGTSYYGLDNTGVSSTCFATVGGKAGQIGAFGSSVQEITMVTSAGATQAQPSFLSTDGTSFSVAWVGASSSTTTTTTSTASLSVSVTTDKTSYTPDSWVYITVHVTDSSTSQPVGGASVKVTVTAPNGAASSGSGTTDSNGNAYFKYHVSPNASAGTYSVKANASAAGYNSGSGQTTFTVS